MKKTISIFTLTILTFLSLGLAQNVLAIGQMTKPIVIENALRGQEIQETLNLFNSEEKEVNYGLVADGDIKNWTTFYTADNLKDAITKVKVSVQSYLNVIAKFKVPDDIPNGTYLGQVAVVTMTEEEENKKEGLNVSVGMRVGRDVSIAVTDKEIVNFQTTIIPLDYGVKKGETLKIKIIYENQGNVVVKPDLQLKILKDDKSIFNAIFPYPEGVEPVKPLERKELPSLIEWQTSGQENGNYRAEVNVMLKNEIVKIDSFRFVVGTSKSGLVAGLKDIEWQVYWPILVLILVAAFAVLVVAFAKRNIKKKEIGE